MLLKKLKFVWFISLNALRNKFTRYCKFPCKIINQHIFFFCLSRVLMRLNKTWPLKMKMSLPEVTSQPVPVTKVINVQVVLYLNMYSKCLEFLYFKYLEFLPMVLACSRQSIISSKFNAIYCSWCVHYIEEATTIL